MSIKEVKVNCVLLFVCYQPDWVMMVVFVRDESLMNFIWALPSLNTRKIFITNDRWTMWGDCLLLKQISLWGLCDAFSTTADVFHVLYV